MTIVHVASVELNTNGGMGRIASEWKLAFEKQGFEFIHIGWKELGKTTHPLLFGWKVRQYLLKHKIKPDFFLVHEPAAGFLYFRSIPLIVFSHGIEEIAWKQKIQFKYELLGWKSKFLPSAIRFYSNNYGFKKANKILLSNNSDKDYLINKKEIDPSKIIIFKNGYHDFVMAKSNHSSNVICLFNASWIERKGIKLLVDAFNHLLTKYNFLKLRLAGTGMKADELFPKFNSSVKKQIEVVSNFTTEEEANIYADTSIFVLPSFFEGQSLALTQAMAMGLCPVAANNSGQSDLIQYEVNGLLFETGNTEQFIFQIEKLINDRSLILTLGDKAKQSVQAFKWETVTKKLLEDLNLS